MKRFVCLVLCVIALISMAACGQKASTWQEQYDLGVRYLSDGNYEEAIIAFTAAIEIDPKRPEAYLGVAEGYIQQGEYDLARAILEDGLDKTDGDQAIEDKLKNWEDGIYRPLNVHGSTEFIFRREYRDFLTLTSDEQDFLVKVYDAMLAQDKDLLIQCAGSENTNCYFYTIYDNRKIFCSNNKSDGQAQLAVEIRSENDLGYFCQVTVATNMSNFSVPDDTTSAIYFDYGTCPCSDWQWSGTVHETDQRYWTYNDRPDNRSEDIIVGELQNSLKVGEERTTGSVGDVINGTYVEDIKSETIRTYENGRLISETYRMFSEYDDGEWREVQKDRSGNYVYSVQGGRSFDSEARVGKDQLWW